MNDLTRDDTRTTCEASCEYAALIAKIAQLGDEIRTVRHSLHKARAALADNSPSRAAAHLRSV